MGWTLYIISHQHRTWRKELPAQTEGSWLTMGRRYAMLRYAVVDDGLGLSDHSWLSL